MKIQNPEIEIAQFVKKLLEMKFPSNKLKSELISFVKGLPSNIIQNGLIQTLAFLKGKSEQQYKDFYDIIAAYISEELLKKNIQNDDVLDYLVKEVKDIEDYLYYQKRVLSFSIWLKRFVLAFYEEEKSVATTS